MKFIKFFVLLILSVKLSAQLPSVYLKPKVINQFISDTKSADLYVVITNEKNPDDAALIESIKAYWKQGNVKYISTVEFNEKFKAKNFDSKNLYLFNNSMLYDMYAGVNNRAVAASKLPMIYFNYGFYLTNKPYDLATITNPVKAPFYLFFSGVNMKDNRGDINKGYYSLMIKNFNHDMDYSKNTDNFKTKPKYKRIKGLAFIKEPSAFDKKTFLLVKEQIPKKEKDLKKKKKSKKDKKESALKNTSLDIHENVLGSEVKSMVVFSEDVDYAVKKDDKDILLYNGGTVYSAQDGSAYATYRSAPNNTFKYISRAISMVTTVAVITIFIINVKNN
ncbi:MAG: hypothetical protein SFY56_00275 [Bacteroidota bacterium]|nr:hypothetical protein [Bacteroidota bacterium]